MTCDEQWIIYSNQNRSDHWLYLTDTLPQTPKVKLVTRYILPCFVDFHIIIHHEYLEVGISWRVFMKKYKNQATLVRKIKLLFIRIMLDLVWQRWFVTPGGIWKEDYVSCIIFNRPLANRFSLFHWFGYKKQTVKLRKWINN